MKPIQYGVVYKDSERAKVLYFGPFVSPSIADFFKGALPEPLEGGYKRQFTIQPFNTHEGYLVSQMIGRGRFEASELAHI